MTAPALHVVVVTGLSGAGRSTALNVLEDLEFFCVDNLPPVLAPRLVEVLRADPEITKVGLGIDVRTGALLEGAEVVFDELKAQGHEIEILFFEATDDALSRRYSETRRPHPLAQSGDVLGAVAYERERLVPLRSRADRVIDTTALNVHDLRRALVEHLHRRSGLHPMLTRFVSFGFKYGIPTDADLVFDVRYLANPHFETDLRPLTGLDPRVANFVLETAEARELLTSLEALLRQTLPRYEREGKAYLTVAIGCTGGRHRSVAIAEELAKRVRADRETIVVHRDAAR